MTMFVIVYNLRKGVTTGVVDIGGQFAANVNDTSCKFATDFNDACSAFWVANIFTNFQKKF